jgi:tRNA(His) 5'-end guanylyltransferase
MPVRDDLGVRMKTFYEQVPKTCLMRRTPVAIRIDGKAFHTFTRGMMKPFDDVLIKSMQDTMKYLCENIQGCVLGYTQSDEITLILVDYKRFDSCAWFDYEVQKLCSVSASMATFAFNRFFEINVDEWGRKTFEDWDEGGTNDPEVANSPEWELMQVYGRALAKGAMFDARCFNIPKEEVTNLVYWRQIDAARNSVQMVGQAYFSHKQLDKKTCEMIQEMLWSEKGINWNDFPATKKRGSCCVKVGTGWEIDNDIPQFKNEGREYIEKLIQPEEV